MLRERAVAASSTSYVSNIAYAPHGGLSSMLLGNGITQTYTYNDQFQQTGVAAGTLLSLNMYPCDSWQVSCAGNTGNILSQTISVGGSVQAVQEYQYDALNRLTRAAERAGTAGFAPSCPDGSSVWCQSYSYDTAGNRTVSQYSGGSATPWDAPGFSASTNRVSGWSYDNAGNTTANGSGETLTYDAENRQTAFCTGGACTHYVYDGEGQRVRRQNPDGTQTVYVYDAFGNLENRGQTERNRCAFA
jgi:YD repeat-containing protein